VDAPQLPHRVVPVLDEDALEEALRSRDADVPGGGGPLPRQRRRARELVEKQPAKRLGGARVAREEGALDDLGKVDEREDRRVDGGEVGGQLRPLLRRERLGRADAQWTTLTPDFTRLS
jgi:hypothetical protein